MLSHEEAVQIVINAAESGVVAPGKAKELQEYVEAGRVSSSRKNYQFYYTGVISYADIYAATRVNKKSALTNVQLTGIEHINSKSLNSELLHYIAPRFPSKPRNAFEWVAKAVAKDHDELKEFCRVVHVNEGVAYGTNGHRLHYAYVGDGVANGVYCPRTGIRIYLSHREYASNIKTVKNMVKKAESSGKSLNQKDEINIDDCELGEFSQNLRTTDTIEIEGKFYNLKYIKDAAITNKFYLIQQDNGVMLYGESRYGKFMVARINISKK